jgi:hypothetical protein
VNLTQQQDEGLLGQVFGFKGVSQHAQTDAVDKPRVQPIDELESRGIAMVGQPNGFSQG